MVPKQTKHALLDRAIQGSHLLDKNLILDEADSALSRAVDMERQLEVEVALVEAEGPELVRRRR